MGNLQCCQKSDNISVQDIKNKSQHQPLKNVKKLNSSYSEDVLEKDKFLSTNHNSIKYDKSTLSKNSENDKMEFLLPEPPAFQNE